MIIFLNGTSSVGKSSLAREIMHQSQVPFLHHSADHILNFWIDNKFVNLVQDDQLEGWQYDWFCRHQYIDKSDRKSVKIHNGKKGWQLYCDLVRATCSLIDKNYDMIIDEIIRSKEQFLLYAQFLLKKKVFLINVICDEAECERREQQRGDRYSGLSRGLLNYMSNIIPFYDFEINTTPLSPCEGAKIILNFIYSNKNPQAFHQCLKLLDPLDIING